MGSIKGVVSNIEEMAVHDGPGLRSLIFLKGCRLRCKWCQNPELQDFRPEIRFHKLRCVGCGECEKVCPVDAISMEGDKERIDKTKCLQSECFECIKVCTKKALEICGREYTAEEVYALVARFKLFYDTSDRGGITISGGDPVHLPEFTAEILRLCQEDGIHTAIETCLHANYKKVMEITKYCDLMMCDLKHMDSDKHKEGTGVPNELILENFKKLNNDFKGEIHVRIPLIPGYNDDKENIKESVKFLDPLKNVTGLDLLPFNTFPITKFESLFLPWEYKDAERQSDEYLKMLKDLVDSYGRFECTLGGLW